MGVSEGVPHDERDQPIEIVVLDNDAHCAGVELDGGHVVRRNQDKVVALVLVREVDDDISGEVAVVYREEHGALERGFQVIDVDLAEVPNFHAHVAG